MPLILQPRPSQLSGSDSETYYLIFFSNSWENPWCPDCEVAKAAIEQVFGKGASTDDVLGKLIDGSVEKRDNPKPRAFLMNVGDKAEWRDPNNIHRTQYGIKSIPTIVRWENGKEVARITDPDNADVEKLRAFVA